MLEKLAIKGNQNKTEVKKKEGPDTKELIMQAIIALGAMAPTLTQLHSKLSENFTLIYQKKSSFLRKLMKALRKAFKIAEKDKICNLPIKDAKTGSERIQKLNVNEFLSDLSRKERVFNGIGTKGIEYQKINASNEDAILAFANKQISEIQSIFVIINALDAYFKNEVDTEAKIKVKGMQIELSALRNSIINANKKRGEYASFKEEHAQMQRLGLTTNV